jgi:hypothetical protein
LLEALSKQPDHEYLKQFLHRALEERGEDIEFIVLYGSRARGDWMPHSDFDMLVGPRIDDDQNFTQRFEAFHRYGSGWVEPFVHSRSEIEQMVRRSHPTILEACDHGVVPFDRGRWAEIRKRFNEWKDKGLIQRREISWHIAPELRSMNHRNAMVRRRAIYGASSRSSSRPS